MGEFFSQLLGFQVADLDIGEEIVSFHAYEPHLCLLRFARHRSLHFTYTNDTRIGMLNKDERFRTPRYGVFSKRKNCLLFVFAFLKICGRMRKSWNGCRKYRGGVETIPAGRDKEKTHMKSHFFNNPRGPNNIDKPGISINFARPSKHREKSEIVFLKFFREGLKLRTNVSSIFVLETSLFKQLNFERPSL